MAEPDADQVHLNVPVPQEWVVRAASGGLKPNDLAAFILTRVDLPTWIAALKKGTTPAVDSRPKLEINARRPTAAWTEGAFVGFLDVVQAEPNFTGPLCLLACYVEVGASPSSQQMRDLAGFSSTDPAWEDQLRQAKYRLTTRAKRMGLGHLFPRPQTVGKDRLHPIEPLLLPWLVKWWRSDHQAPLPSPNEWHKISKTR